MKTSDQVTHGRGGGVRTRYLVTPAAGPVGMLCGITEFEPASSLPLHFHNCDEAVTVIDGAGQAQVDGETVEVAAGDAVWISAGVHHRFLAGPDRPMRIHWTYARSDATRTLVASGETVPIGGERDRNY